MRHAINTDAAQCVESIKELRQYGVAEDHVVMVQAKQIGSYHQWGSQHQRLRDAFTAGPVPLIKFADSIDISLSSE